MARTPKPWWREDRQAWFVTIRGVRHNLGPDKKQADKRYYELMAEPEPEPIPKQTGTILSEIYDHFLGWCKKHRAPRTFDWYLERIEPFLKFHPGLTLENLKPKHIRQWLDTKPDWAPGQQRGAIVALQRPLNWAMEEGEIDSNPIAKIKKPMQGRRDEVVTQEQFDEIIARYEDQEFVDLLTVAFETGCRPEEILAVEASHVDIERSLWEFPPEEAKGKKAFRIVYLTEKTVEICKRLVEKWPEGKLFRNTSGDPWTAYAINCRFLRLKKHIGRKLCLYAMRHSFATNALKNGVDPVTVSVLMGHQDASMLSKVYQHLARDPEYLRKAVKRAKGQDI